MNSNGRIVLCIFIIIATNTIHFAFGKYEPLYVRKKTVGYGYDLIQKVRYYTASNTLLIVESFGHEVLLACPIVQEKMTTINSLEIQKREQDNTLYDHICQTEIQSKFYTPSWPTLLWSVIGFTIFTPDEEGPKYNYYAGVPKTLLPVVKVQLAPADDFFFANWESASRHNAITVPMWKELLEQWQALEIFIRRVAQITDSVEIRTGVYYNTLTQPGPDDDSQTLYLKDGKHPIPKYFWKAVSIQTPTTLLEPDSRGILFVMHNNTDPNFNSNERKICPNDDVSELGWKFLPDDRFKSLMYGCFLNEENLNSFQEKIFPSYDHKLFDLRDMPVKEYDDKGIFPTGMIKRVNVLDEIQKLQQAKNGDNQNPPMAG